MKAIVLFSFCVFLSFHAMAITHPSEKIQNPIQEARAVKLTQQLRCVVCQNESIEESHADIARDLRALVRTQIIQGKTDSEITAFLRARYGDYIMLEPPINARTSLLWLAPIFVFLFGALMAAPTLKRRRRKP
jgi:cytochrome c-type biogenesis protein CcmH